MKKVLVRVVWPAAADSPADNAAFFTVRRDMELNELNAAIAEWSVTVQKGDLITFAARRIANGKIAEGAVHPVVTIE